MRSHITKLLRQSPKFSSKNLSNSRFLNTVGDSKKSMGLAMGLEDDSIANLIQESPMPPLNLPNADLFSYTLCNIEKYPKFTAVECGATGRNYTYAQMLDGALRFSTYIQKLLPGVKNPTVAFLTPNSPEYMSMFFGCMAIGATVSPINPSYTPRETAGHIKDCGASILIVDAMVEVLADSALKLLGKNMPVIVNGKSNQGRPNVQDILVDSSVPMTEPVLIDPSSIAFLPYSSGTTGKPKGVQISHAAMTNNMAMYINDYVCRAKTAEGDYQETFLGILPLFHIYGTMAGLLPSILYGAKFVTLPIFEPNLFVSTIKNHKMSIIAVVPPLLNFIARTPLITKEDLSELHTFCIGGASVPQGAALSVKEKTPNAIFQEGYGLTETLLTHITPLNDPKIGYCGLLLPRCQAKIIDLESGRALPANTKGELCVKVPSMMTGYHNNEEATKEMIDENGWLHTGDVAIYTEDGYFSIVDRIKELIKVKGLQVSPSEVEETLLSHPDIADAGVVGVPHARYGEAPMAFIVRADPTLTEDKIHKHMAQHLAKHKSLEGGIKFVNELPKNQTGKLLRRVLKGMAEKS